MQRMRVNIFKDSPKDPKAAFGRWKERAQFIGEIESREVPKKTLYASSPSEMGRLLALNLRQLPFCKTELFSKGGNTPLQRDEIKPILDALVGELGAQNVKDMTGE